MTTTQSVRTTYRKHAGRGGTRYYVDVEGTQAGWVCKSYDGTWDFWATTVRSLEGNCLIRGCRTRRDAVIEGLSSLAAFHSGLTWRLNMETVRDEAVIIPTDVLRQAWEQLLDEKYGEA